ncbi:hypothetical protein HY230_10485 [Candidatus Acetothermia bacterium]|nr:hypothetical protein [Candidatus Acetothermia bacterium]
MVRSRVAALIAVLVLSGVAGNGASSLVWALGSTTSFSVLVEEESAGVRFSVEGDSVTTMHARVLGLDGRTLFDSGWIARPTVTWSMVSQTGQPTASGVYLYVISVRDRDGKEEKKLGKLALVHGQEPTFTVSSVGELATTEPAAAQFPFTPGTSWSQRLGTERSDTYRILRRPARTSGGPPTSFEQLLQLGADGKLRIKELCLGTVFAPYTPQNPDNLSSLGDCRNSWTPGGGSTSNGWVDDGTVVRLETSTDNVGIGTTNPIARLEAVSSAGGIALLGTSDSRAIIGRLGNISCPTAPYAVGGCAGAVSGAGGVVGRAGPGGIGVLGDSDARGIVGTLGGTSCAPGSSGKYGVGGCAGSTNATGVLGRSGSGRAIEGLAEMGIGVFGSDGSGGIGVWGNSTARGVVGTLGPTSCAGTYAVGGCTAGSSQVGVLGSSESGFAMLARTTSGTIFSGLGNGTQVVRIDNTGKGFFNGGTTTGGADFAESMRTTDDPTTLELGDVLIIDPQQPRAVKKSTTANSRLVAGVYSTKPSVLSIADHHIDDSLAGEVPLAVVGIVPTKVTTENGAIHIGDLLVSSSTPGHAMRAPDNPALGTILGKALGPLESGNGVIEVLVMLR